MSPIEIAIFFFGIGFLTRTFMDEYEDYKLKKRLVKKRLDTH